MPRPHPEFAMHVAAIGVPWLRRGEWLVGGACLVAAGAVATWLVVLYFRARRK